MKIYKPSEMHNGKYLFCYLKDKNKNGDKTLKIVVFNTSCSFECLDYFSCFEETFDQSLKFLKGVYEDD